MAGTGHKLVRYAGPVVVLYFYQSRWDNLSLAVVAGSLWYLVLAMATFQSGEEEQF